MPPRPPRNVHPRRPAGHAEGGRGGHGSATAPGGTPALAARHVQSMIVKRPNFGSESIRQLTVNVNAYEITIPEEYIRHYDVTIQPEASIRRNIKIIKHLQQVIAPNVFTPHAVYDGRKNLFATRDLPLGQNDSAKYTFTLFPPRPNARRPPDIYEVSLTKVATLQPEILHRFLAGQQSVDDAIQAIITALNVAIRMEVIYRYTTNAKSFFIPEGNKAIGSGIELWRGYFQSVRPAMGRMLVNVDITTGVMYKSGPLIDICLNVLGITNTLALSPRRGFGGRNLNKLRSFLSNVSVTTIHSNRNRLIKGFSDVGARDLRFAMNETQIDVATYFRVHANRTLTYPDLICIETETGALIPLELCNVLPGQLMKKDFPADKTKDMIEFSRKKPTERFSDIKKGLDLLSFEQSDIVRNFGLRVQSSEPLAIPARVLATPPVEYHHTSKEKSVKPMNGMWNMVDKKFYQPAKIEKWIVLVYESQGRFPREAADHVIKDFVRCARARGMTIMVEQPLVKWHNGQGDILKQLTDTENESTANPPRPKDRPNFILAILPSVAGDIYTQIKRFGDVMQGVSTQCLQAMKCSRANDQFWNNVLLKVNPKLGGINSILNRNFVRILDEPTIIMGADVMHPPPRAEGRPSHPAVVGSVDSNAVKYIAKSGAQTGRVENIIHLKDMCLHILKKYRGYQISQEKKSANAAVPKRLIFFRDGVSEGEFKMVLDKELKDIRGACREAGMSPKITLIVVGKRHHYRFCPQNPNDKNQADPKSGNCPAGMVVDQAITHPVDFDYYLLSHGGLIGTSRPAHYSVLYDENGFNADNIQKLSFALCHIFARATRSVSIPAPVYYAHLVCQRARNHYASGNAHSDSASTTTGGGQNVQETYEPVHRYHEQQMYFM